MQVYKFYIVAQLYSTATIVFKFSPVLKVTTYGSCQKVNYYRRNWRYLKILKDKDDIRGIITNIKQKFD